MLLWHCIHIVIVQGGPRIIPKFGALAQTPQTIAAYQNVLFNLTARKGFSGITI